MILAALQHIIDHPDGHNSENVEKARGFLAKINNPTLMLEISFIRVFIFFVMHFMHVYLAIFNL